MTPEQWKLVKAVVADAMELPVTERATYVDRACGTNTELRAEVDSLLAVAGEDGDSLPDARVAIANAAAAALGMDGDASAIEPEVYAALESALDQQYEILRPLGRGGMGTVYLARDRALERFVAIKVLRPDVAALHGGRERFRREARIVAQLSHPGILSLHTFGEVRGLWYFVTGYVRGATLAERLRVEGRLDAEESRRILAEVADALAYAHEHGIIHRDIKPANILLDEDTGRAVLADFGIAKLEGAADELTSKGMVVGTPSYMSPEQAAGNAGVDARSDIYSLGVVAHTMLAGRDALPLDRLPTTIRRELAQAVHRCLSLDPELRWQSARHLGEALLRANDSTDDVPEGLRDLPSFGAYAATWALFWSILAAQRRGPWDGLLLLLVAIVVPIGFVLHFANLHRRGVPKRELARVAFWPPEWWGMWWPTSLRRPHDMWSRLPWPAKAIRIVMSVFCMALPTLVLAHATDRVKWSVVAVAASALAAALAWARRRALDWGDAVRVLFGATSPSIGWSALPITHVLAPAHDRVRPPDAASPADHRRAIAELAALLPGRLAALRADAPLLAHRLLMALDDCALEAAALARDASAAELDRLTAQLGGLESEPARVDDECVELIALVRRQLELVRGMRIRAEVVAQRRAKLLGFMRGLWAQLRAATAPPSEESKSVAEMITRFHAFRREAETELHEPKPAT
ncbi:MAG TPA: serine/threonine-protein kinase [Gemmatimonadaceae bacterium]